VISAVLIVVVTLAILVVLTRAVARWEAMIAFAGYGLHTAFSGLQVWLHTRFYNGVGDMFGYLDEGGALARLMSVDFSRFGWETLQIFLQLNPRPGGSGVSSTQSMSAATAFILFGVGDSMLAGCLFVGALATLSQAYLYLTLRSELAPSARRGLAVAMFLVPSVVFWSSAITKEGLTISFLAFLAAGSLLFARRRWVVGGLSGAVGVIGVAMLKPYVLFPFVLGVAAWAYAARARRGRGLRVIPLLAAAVFALLGLALMGVLFPEFSLGHFAKEAAHQQELGAEVSRGGSYVEVGDAGARTFWEQIPFIPLAFINSMFRPFIFEARNAPMLGAALESTLLTVASVALVIRLRWRGAVDAIRRSPLLAFCVTFTISFAIAVGLATTNLGTLSRYRLPMMPCYVIAAFLLWHEGRVSSATSQSNQLRTVRRPTT